MKFSRTALKVLKSQYLSVLKKCALINAGLFFLAVPAVAVEVSNFDEFRTEWNKDEDNVLDFTGDIKADSEVLNSKNEKKVTINGNGHTLDLNHVQTGPSMHNTTAEINHLRIINSTGNVISGYNTFILSNLTLEKNIDETQTNASVINIGRYALLEKLTDSVIRNNNGRGMYISGDNTLTVKNISNTDFINNKVKDGNGGGIYIHNMGRTNNIEANFTGNEALNGGAIYLYRHSTNHSEAGSIYSLKGSFTQNKASISGGAIYNSGNLYDVQGRFEGNEAAENGGAIFNSDIGRTTIRNSTFIGNKAKNAGAIYNNFYNNLRGSLSISDSTFIGNIANGDDARGGAIDNSGLLYIYATDSDTIFTGNTAGDKSNALYVRGSGTVSLQAQNGKKIIFNDGIDGENGTAIAIRNSDAGMVEFNNLVENNTVNLYSGTLKLGSYGGGEVNGKTVAASSGSFDDTVNFNVHGGKLDLADGEIRETNLGNVNLQENLNLGIDVALADAKADTIKAHSVNVLNDSKINLSDFNLLNDADKNITEVTVTGDSNLYDAVSLGRTNISVGDSVLQNYLITYNDGKLKFGKDQTLQTAIQLNTQEDRAYAMGSSETLDEDLGALAGTSLIISSNGRTVDGNRYQGVSVAGGQTLSLQNTSFTNFNGAVVDNSGTLELKADNHDMTIDGDIDGLGGKIVVNGQKTVALNGAVSGNDVNLQSGVLALGNDTVLANAGKFKAEGGTLDVGLHNATAGDVTFESGSTLAVTVNTDAHGSFHADNLTVKDGANLKATLAQGLVGRGEEKGLQLVSATNGWDDNFILAHDNNMYKFEKGNTAGEYIVTLAQTAEEVVRESGGTQNNANAAEAWVDGDKFPAGSSAQQLADKLASLAQNNAQGFNDALTALAPEVAPVVKTAAVDHSNQIFNAVSTRMSGGSVGSAAEGKSSGDSMLDGGATWVQLLANKTKFDGNRKAHGFDSKSAGLAMGAEKYINEDVKAGVGYAYTSSDIDSFMRDIDVDTHTVFAYGEYKPSNWFVNGVASYSFSGYDEHKNVAGSRYKAKYDVDNFGLQVMTGYDTMLGKAEFTPMAGLRYNRIHRDGYTDTADQRVSSDNMDVLTAVLGAKIYKNFTTCGGTHWKPEARLAMTYDVVSDKENAVVGLLNGSSYFVEGERLNRFGIEAGLGLQIDVNDNVETSVGYEGRFREDYQDHTGMVSAKYKF